MESQLDSRTRNLIYHTLGHNLTEGLSLFEPIFRQAEANFNIAKIDELLKILSDRTLQKEQRLVWYKYYSIRKAFLLWQRKVVEDFLEEAESGYLTVGIERVKIPEDDQVWERRLAFLKGQTQVTRGDWISGLKTLGWVLNAARLAEETILEADAAEWIIQAYLGRAQSAGGWNNSRNHGFSILFRHLLTLILLPFYALIWIYLWQIDVREFWRPVLRYGADCSNWPIFWYYLRATRVFDQAKRAAPTSDKDRIFRLEVLRADLLRRLFASREALTIYQKLLDDLPSKNVDYLAALLKHGKAQTLLDLGKSDEAQILLKEARPVYDQLEDKRAVAFIDLLLGDIAIQAQTPDYNLALSHWKSSLHKFDDQQDTVGLAEGLSRCYFLLEDKLPDEVRKEASRIVRDVKRQVFMIRLSNRLFNLLQLAVWVVPILVVLSLAIFNTDFASKSSTAEAVDLAQDTLAGQGMFVTAIVMVALMVTNLLIGLIGLVYTLRVETVELDFIVVDEVAIYRYDFVGRKLAYFPWSGIEIHLRVERDLATRPLHALSYDYLQTTEGKAMRLPGTTAWFQHLQQEVERRIGRSPQRYHLRWFGIQFIVLNILMPIIVSVAFMLTLGGSLGVSVRAWLASLIMAGANLGVFYITAGWLLHFVRVYRRVISSSWFVSIVCVLVISLIGLSVFGKPVVFIFGPLFIFWGMLLVLSFAYFLPYDDSRKWQVPVFRGIVLVVGTLLILHLLLPILINWQALTYVNAAEESDPNREKYFETMEQAGEWMTKIDPTYPFGYAYIGYANYFWGLEKQAPGDGYYKASLYAFDRAIGRFGIFSAPRDFYYCRAMVYDKLRDEHGVQQNCEIFRSKNGSGKTRCEQLFLKDIGVCKTR